MIVFLLGAGFGGNLGGAFFAAVVTTVGRGQTGHAGHAGQSWHFGHSGQTGMFGSGALTGSGALVGAAI